MGQNLGYWNFYFFKFIFFKFFVLKFIFGAGTVLSRAFTGEAGAEKKYLEPEPRKNGSAPQHCNQYMIILKTKQSINENYGKNNQSMENLKTIISDDCENNNQQVAIMKQTIK